MSQTLFAYYIESLVPSSPNANIPRMIFKLSGNKSVQFFAVGTLCGRTFIIYMKKKCVRVHTGICNSF